MEKGFCLERSEEETEGSDGTCEDTADTTMFVQIEEAKYAIHKLPFMTVLAPVRSVCDKGRARVADFAFVPWLSRAHTLGLPKKQEPAVRLSREHRTELTCLQELL